MRKPKLLEDYTRFAYDTVQAFAHSVVRQTATSTFIENGKGLAQAVDKAVGQLDADVAAIDHPTPAQTAWRDQLRDTVYNELGRLAKRLNLDYPGDEPALLSSGLTLAEATNSAAARQLLPDAPLMDFDLLDGSQAGCLLLRLRRPAGSVQNLIRYSTDQTLAEDHWCVAVGGGRERQLGPFASGTRVWVKAAGLTGSTTEPQYSTVKTRLVQ